MFVRLVLLMVGLILGVAGATVFLKVETPVAVAPESAADCEARMQAILEHPVCAEAAARTHDALMRDLGKTTPVAPRAMPELGYGKEPPRAR